MGHAGPLVAPLSHFSLGLREAAGTTLAHTSRQIAAGQITIGVSARMS